jgi:hypothetical protein
MARPRTRTRPASVPEKLPRGVYWFDGRYVAQGYLPPEEGKPRKTVYLGRFDTPEEAHKAAMEGERLIRRPGAWANQDEIWRAENYLVDGFILPRSHRARKQMISRLMQLSR